MITDEFANSLYPYLANILTNGSIPEKLNTSKSSVYFLNSSQGIFDEDEYENVEEEEKQQVVAVLPIKGPILKYSQFCGPIGTKTLQSRLERWKGDDNIVAVLLDIDSGGGQVAGTAEFAEYLYNYPKRIESYTDGVIASAAFHIASATKKITANPHSDAIGSIGTMFKSLNLDGYFEKLGAKVNEEYASKSTKKNHAYRELKKGNPEPLIKTELDPINESFHSQVNKYRPQINSDVFDGQHTVVIEKAKELGLIDVIADKASAINSLFEQSKEDNLEQNTEINNQNQIDMAESENNLESLSATLGIEGGLKLSSKLFGGKKGAFLTVEQLELVENSLTEANTNLSDEQTAHSTAKTQATLIKSAITEALTKASLEDGDTPEASIKLLGEKVAEYGSQPGEKLTTTQSDGDRFEEGEGESTSIMDSL